MTGAGGNSANTTATVTHAEKVIRKAFGYIVSVDEYNKDVVTFGENPNVGSGFQSTLMALPPGILTETYVNDNLITHIASTSGLDSGIPLLIEGHTLDVAGDFTHITQIIMLDGQNKTALATPLARVHNAINIGSLNLTGTIYVAEDVAFVGGVPQIDTAIHIIILAGKNKSTKSSFTTASNEHLILTQVSLGVVEKSSATVSVSVEVRPKGGVFFEVGGVASSNSSHTTIPFMPHLTQIGPNNDIRMQVISSGANIDVIGGFFGYIALIK